MKRSDFDNDIFISYAHIDNQALLSEEAQGWIDQFHKTLEVRLAQVFGSKPRIWRDLKLQGNDFFSDEILDQFPKVALLISIVSPRYIRSEWCTREVEAFWNTAAQGDGVSIGNKARIFKVIKTHVPPEEHPAQLQDLLGYEFYQLDADTGRPVEYSQEFGREAGLQFLHKLNDLAYDICQLLESIEADEAEDAASEGQTVYLAETTYDLRDTRDALKRELLEHGHRVLPDRPLPPVVPELEEVVREYLDQCVLSIHLIGQNYGLVPEGARQSIAELQSELAARRADGEADFVRLLWQPPDLIVEDERQQAVVQQLQAAADERTELLATSLEELKNVIHEKLRPPPAPQPEAGEATADGDELVYIYLVHDPRDAEAVTALDDYLYDQGYEVRRPLDEGDEAQVREDHIDNLKECDAVLIYYGRADERWVRLKLQDLRKVAGYGRDKPMLSRAVYVAGPDSSGKQRYRTREAEVIKSSGDFDPADLDPFLDPIRAERSA